MVERVDTMDVDEVAAALREETGELDLAPEGARLYLSVLRKLTQGLAVKPQDVAQFASDAGLSAQRADEVLLWLAEKNEAGHIIGLGGLSLNDRWTHRFKVDGNDLRTWCAFDTLYLPPLLKQTAEVESPDPVTGAPIRLTVGQDRVESHTPAGAVISLVIPSIKEQGIRSAEKVWTAFCHYSHYFESETNGAAWFEGRGQEPLFLPLEEGFKLGQIWFEKINRHA